jgi:predicted nucleotide-binding protein (sugar kinase/HSP70/actin superfamily)
VYSMHVGMRIAYKFYSENVKGRDLFPSLGCAIVLTGFSQKQTGFNHMSSHVRFVIKVALEWVFKFSGRNTHSYYTHF